MRESNVTMKNEQIRTDSAKSQNAISSTTMKGEIIAKMGWEGGLLIERCPNSEF